MAKLSAHGNEVLRYSREDKGDGQTTDWGRVTYAVMSDGVVLAKRDVNFVVGGRHTWGWKRFGKMRAGADLRQSRERAVKAGYTIETDNVPAAATA